MVNPYKCGRCKVFFDSDLRLLNGGAPHHLPVSCLSCPYTICHVCYTDWLADGRKEGDISCPDCEAANGFNAERPNVHPFACQLLAARAATAGAIVVPAEQPTVAAMVPPLASQQKDLDNDQKPAAASAPRAARSNPVKQTRAKKEGAAESAVTEEELEALKKLEIVNGMNEWLKTVAKVSEANQRNVMRKVELLCEGNGLAVSSWPDGIIFMKDSPVNLSMNFEDVLNEAKEWESKYGRDPGNGWAMKHAISNLRKYQKYVLEEKLRKPGRPSGAQSAIVSTPPKPKKQQQNHSESEAEPILTPSAKPAGRKQHCSKSESELEVTEEELVALENHEVVSGMREWLENVVKAPEKSIKNILAKVGKLCDGAGLHISTWPNDVSFMEGYEVNLSMDFEDMINEAKAQEDKHGMDPGSGWAIRRPVAYLIKYQRYVLEEKLRKLKPAVVTPSPKENKRKQDDSLDQPEPAAAAAAAAAPPTKPAAKKQKLAKPTSEEIEVSVEELEALENVDIVSGISEWLDNVAKVSKTNKRNVMIKLEKLCAGDGIHVYGWPDSVFFMRGHKINLAMDFDDMLKEEKAYENKYGRDKGNGWGLRHPISNLRKYQKYVLEEKLRK